MIEQQLLQLISEYQQAVTQAWTLLHGLAHEGSILAAVRKKSLPRAGKVGKSNYQFHGIGCRFSCKQYEVDFDFGPNERHDGFDVYRLHLFARSVDGKYPEFESIDVLSAAFDSLVEQGRIRCPKWSPSNHLCYLEEDLERLLLTP